MKPNNARIVIRLPQELKEKLQLEADLRNITLSNYIRRLINIASDYNQSNTFEKIT